MSGTAKSKWFACTFLAGLLLIVALMGGEWGIKYEAQAYLHTDPHIDWILPNHVMPGSPTIVMVIGGANFGNRIDTSVRIRGTGIDDLLIPATILPNRIWVAIPFTYLEIPSVYTITVVIYDIPPIPTIPPPPPIGESNSVIFLVVDHLSTFYLPLINK